MPRKLVGGGGGGGVNIIFKKLSRNSAFFDFLIFVLAEHKLQEHILSVILDPIPNGQSNKSPVQSYSVIDSLLFKA